MRPTRDEGELPSAQKVTVRKNSGANVGARSRLNFIEGANVTLTIADDAVDVETDITIASATAAPTGAQYIVGATDATLTAERLVTDTATASWDLSVPGQAKVNVIDDSISNAKLRNSSGFSVIGKGTTGSGDPGDIIAADETVLGRTAAGNLIFAALATGQITNDAVTYAKLQNVAGFSVVGKATTGAGDAADITAADETVLGRTAAGNVAFAALATGQIAAKAVTYAKIQDVSATDRFLGRDTAGAGVVEEITVAAALTMLGAFSSVVLQQFTATGANTYTPTTGMKYCIAISTGGGGGGGGADVTGAADCAAGAGGGAGGTCIEAFSAATIGASQTVTIGAGGTGGNDTGGTGVTGNNTTFGALHTANGGTGGTGSGAASTVNTRVVAGGAGGTPTGGLMNMVGGTGENGWAMQTTDATDTNETSIAFGGHGGSSFWGGGGRGGANAQDAAAADSTGGSEVGAAGAAKGSGGGGAAVNNTATGVAGGTGADGYCLVIEFV